MQEGEYTIEYYSTDNVENAEEHKNIGVIIDNSAPETMLTVEGIRETVEGKLFVTGITTYTLNAVDGGAIPCGAGKIEYKVDAVFWQNYTEVFNLSGFSEGEHTIYYRAIDNLGNLETEKSLAVIIDNSSPETTMETAAPKYQDYVTSNSGFMLDAEDQGVIPSGIKETKYRINYSTITGTWLTYSTTFYVFGDDGIYTIGYYSQDNLLNTEVLKSTTVKLDNSPPATRLVFSGKWSVISEKTYIRTDTEVILTASDPIVNGVASGMKEILCSLDDLPLNPYHVPLLLAEGIHAVKYYAIDNLGNTETVHEQVFYVDGTAPLTELVIGDPKFEAFGSTVITPGTQVEFTANDPEISGAASGLNYIEYRIDSGSFTIYTGTFTLTEGIHLLEYRSLDNVLNTEEIKKSTLTVTYISRFAAYAENNIALSGQGKITGDTRSNGLIQLSGQAVIEGNAETAEDVTLSGQAQVTGEIIEGAVTINPWAIDLEKLEDYVSANNDNDKLTLINGELKVSGQSRITITTGTYYLNGITASGQSRIYFNGKIRIFCTKQITVSGQAELHHSGDAYDLIICQHSQDNINISGQGELISIIYAPQSKVSVSGQGITLGNVMAKEISVSGQGKIKGIGSGSEEGAPMGVMAFRPAPEENFALTKTYSYPNPAKSVNPAIHIECGTADRIEIKIYNIAGERVHETELSGSPNSSDAYEYVWDTNGIASGVYIYLVRAHGNGKTEKMLKKLAVIK